VHLLTTRIPEVAARFSLHSTVVDELDADAGARLLAGLAPDAVRADPVGARELVDLVAGLPLALVLLGNYLRVQSVRGGTGRVRAAMAQLRDARQRLIISEPLGILEGGRDASISLLASIQLSDNALTPPGRRALRDITAFPAKPNSFSAPVAAAVVDGAADAVQMLVDLGLLEYVGADRYTLHQAIHDYAAADGPSAAARSRLVGYYTAALTAADVGGDSADWSADLANVLAALDAAYELGMREELVSGANSLAEQINRRGLLAQTRVQVERAAAAADELGDARSRCRSRINLAGVFQQLGELPRAETLLREALTQARAADLAEMRFDALLGLGWVLGQSGQDSRAREMFEEARGIFAEHERPAAVAAALQGLGWLDGIHGRRGSAADSLREALGSARSSGDMHRVADVLQSLGWMEGMRGRRNEAQAAFAEAAELAREGRFPTILVDALNGLGWLDGLRGDYAAARARFEEGLRLAEEAAYSERGALLGNLAWVTREEGDFAAAEASFAEALTLSRENGETEKVALFLGKLAEIEVLLDRLAEAEAHLSEAVALARAQDLPHRLVEPLRTLATVARQQGRHEYAFTLLDEADAHARRVGNEFLLAEVANERGLAHLDRGELYAAESCLAEGEQAARRAEAGDATGRALFGRAKVALAGGDVARARALATDALDVFGRASPIQARQVQHWREQLGEVRG